ncbi:MAG: ATP-binding protein [Bdellovibrionaceae bacterium]|nr:ATP-binding protein [Pseudobdellovibrionaceae bacterium]
MNNLSIDDLLSSQENEALDFKQEYPSTNSDLIHDILNLANSITDSDRYLVFGVQDNKNICGIETDNKRKSIANIITILRSARLNKIPKISLKTICFQNHEIDILIIKNEDEKPYFLTEDYTSNGRPLRAGAIFSRVADTNTPVNSTTADHIVEKMFYERFGFKLTPKEKLFKYLHELQMWSYGYNENGNLYFFHERFPEFTIVAKDQDFSESYVEPWSINFPDKNSKRRDFFVKYNGTILDNLTLIWLDGTRGKRIQPYRVDIQKDDTYYLSYYYVENSLDHLVNKMIQKCYPDTGHQRRLEKLFPSFKSHEDAEKILNEDFAKELKEYTWYYFNKKDDDFIIIESGKEWKIFWKR